MFLFVCTNHYQQRLRMCKTNCCMASNLHFMLRSSSTEAQLRAQQRAQHSLSTQKRYTYQHMYTIHTCCISSRRLRLLTNSFPCSWHPRPICRSSSHSIRAHTALSAARSARGFQSLSAVILADVPASTLSAASSGRGEMLQGALPSCRNISSAAARCSACSRPCTKQD